MKQRIFLIFLVFSLLLCVGCSSDQDAESFRMVDMEEAIALMRRNPDCIILDVRTWEEYEAGHIPNAICIPNETITTEPLADLSDLDQLILIYCRSGNRSKQAARKMVQAGYTNIVEFGGIIDWPGAIVQE